MGWPPAQDTSHTPAALSRGALADILASRPPLQREVRSPQPPGARAEGIPTCCEHSQGLVQGMPERPWGPDLATRSGHVDGQAGEAAEGRAEPKATFQGPL